MADQYHSQPHKIIIGLVGTSGSGKNEAAKYFVDFGAQVIDADMVSRKILKQNECAIIEMFKRYNSLIQNNSGSLNKTEFAKLLFSSPTLLAKHEANILPQIENEIESEIKRSDKNIIVLNAPTLHKTKLIKEVDFFVYVSALFIVRLHRVKKRDKISCREIMLRFKNQKNFYDHYKATGKKIYKLKNNFSKKVLQKKVRAIMEQER